MFSKAFTLVEILIVVVIATILIGIAVPTLMTAKAKSTRAAQRGAAKNCNDAVSRVILNGTGGIRTTNQWTAIYGSDPVGALNFLHSNGYIIINGQ